MKILLIIFVLISKPAFAAVEANCTLPLCGINQDGDPVCQTQCVNDNKTYEYVWFPQTRVEAK
jgi:hypothetical protein